MSKIEHQLITRNSWGNVGGLMGNVFALLYSSFNESFVLQSSPLNWCALLRYRWFAD